MTWSELSNFLNSQRLALVPRPISEFAQIGEKAADTFKRLEKITHESLDEAVRGFAKSKTWPALWTAMSWHRRMLCLGKSGSFMFDPKAIHSRV
jgi:hypothetical protein